MPERRYARGCGRHCLRCWRNRLVHANKHTPADADTEITGEEKQCITKYRKWMDDHPIFDHMKPTKRKEAELHKRLVAEFGPNYTEEDKHWLRAQS